MRALLLLALVLASCAEPRSARCRDVCAREAECHESTPTDDNFDEGECLDACATLERDSKAQELVAQHHACVRAAPTCEAVLTCRP